MKQETIAIHAGYEGDKSSKSVTVPLNQTAAYEFDNAQHAADLFNLEIEGNIYTRLSNPTTDVLEKRVAALEGGTAALAVSSGAAALHYAILTLFSPGKNIISVPNLYGGTYTLFAHVFPQQGLDVRFAKNDSVEEMEKLIDENTIALYCESIGNPAGNIVDIEALADLAHLHECPLLVDNTVATPIIIRPIDYGADIVVHSLTKYMGGHGNSLGGVIVESGKFPWTDNDKFPGFNEPEVSYHGVVYAKDMGDKAFIARARTVPLRNTGSALSPMNAFLILQGIETLSLRMERHCDNAMAVAEYLHKHPAIAWVNYGGLAHSSYYELAKKYCDGKPSSLLSFGIKNGIESGIKFYDKLELIKRVTNIGDVRSLATHPASTTHRQLSDEERRAAGVTDDMIRLSVGIEHIDDILADIEQALEE
ncbi:MAG: O-acetylhomoserine aminocarboxypropyltransferase/cysteine synthase [Candidatus Marinimicrobia bacterium]|nr:O-acetylhomoserine aminocarboxypropyltransferase/cysteine synthase [Candidatus Neomarinimicrobiota bacterium]